MEAPFAMLYSPPLSPRDRAERDLQRGRNSAPSSPQNRPTVRRSLEHRRPATGSPSTLATGKSGSPPPAAPGEGAAPAHIAPPRGLVVPTDRVLEELDEWLPRLGRLRVDREVRLSGFALYGIRSWYLSRTHWTLTIAVSTGKPTEKISCYVLVPLPTLSASAGASELQAAQMFLANEAGAHARDTEHGTLLVSSPAGYGQDIAPVPGGDLREAWPFIVLNTALRRLGCGGRAAMGNEPPVPPVRRKFYESYLIPAPGSTASPPTSPSNAPATSPTSATTTLSSPQGQRTGPSAHARSWSTSAAPPPGGLGSATAPGAANVSVAGSGAVLGTPGAGTALLHDPLLLNAAELVRLIQGSLAVWGMFGEKLTSALRDVEMDGLFCDETKAAIFRWRTVMGMEREDSLKLERETSGGCIDPRTLSALLSSVTSVRYQLEQLGVERLPKDPFAKPGRFLTAWREYQTQHAKSPAKYISVASIRALNAQYISGRRGHATDALKVHRLLLSGASAVTNSISANLKGDRDNEASTPLRKREQHLRFRGDDTESGVGMIVHKDDVGSVAAPDVITTDLEAYTRGVLKSREREWDLMGARRIAYLWNGDVGAQQDGRGQHVGRLRVLARRTRHLRDKADSGEESSAPGVGHAIGALKARTGAKLKGFVGRRNNDDTSESESPTARKTGVPTLIEPQTDMEGGNSGMSRSPSPAPPRSRLDPYTPSPRHVASLSPLGTAQRISAASDSDAGPSGFSPPRTFPDEMHTHVRNVATPAPTVGSTNRGGRTLATALSGERVAGHPHLPSRTGSVMSERQLVWHARARSTAMLRTASDGADVVIEDGGVEWAVANPHGTGRRLITGPGGCVVRSLPPSARLGAGFPHTASSEGINGANGHAEEDVFDIDPEPLKRTHSLQDRAEYRGLSLTAPEHLAIDVEMCAAVIELRKRERQLAKRAKDMAILERSAFNATTTIFDAARARRERIEALEAEVRGLKRELARAAGDDVDEDRALQWASDKIQFFLSEDTNTHEVSWRLRDLENEWEALRAEHERNVEEIERDRGRPWWRLGL